MEKPSYEELWSRLETALGEIDKLKRKLAEAEKQLADQRKDKRQAAPFRKEPDEKKERAQHKKPGRPPGHEPARRMPPPPDKIAGTERVPVDVCPCCAGELIDRREQEHFVVDIPRVEAQWKRFIIESGFCDKCKRRRSGQHPELPSRRWRILGIQSHCAQLSTQGIDGGHV